MANSNNTFSDIEYVHQLVYDLKLNELQFILEAIKQNKSGSKSVVRKRILNLLSGPTKKTRYLRQKIIQVYKARTNYNQQQPRQQQPMFQATQDPYNVGRPLRIVPHPLTNSIPRSILSTVIAEPPQPSTTEFEDLPFFKTIETLLLPMLCKTSNAANFTGLFYLTDTIRHTIVKSWNIAKQEYKIQIILRLVQDGPKENGPERLPYNISVSVNDCSCKLPNMTIPTKAGITPWRCNVPIDITQQTELRNCSQNSLKISWSEEMHAYVAGVYVAEKLTWEELLVQLKSKPLRSSYLTRESIKKSMMSDADMGIDSMFATIKDPLSKTRMQLPARGVDCIHMQCFDAIQFLQMNEQKQTWLCPLCKKKVKFEDIEVDEYFLEILQSPLLTDDCENVLLFKNGNWAVKQNKEDLKKSNQDNSKQPIEVFTLSDSDDDEPKVTSLKDILLKESFVKSEHIPGAENQTKTNVKNSSEHDLVLDLSLKNNDPMSSSVLNNESVITLSDLDSPPLMESSNILSNIHLPNITISSSMSKDYKPFSNPETSTRHKQIEKDNSRTVLCVITLD